MKKLMSILLLACLLLPFAAFAEDAAAPVHPEVDFTDFTMPVPSDAAIEWYDREKDDGLVAMITYPGDKEQAFEPYMFVWWFPNNMSAYLKRVHPLDYAKSLTAEVADSWREDGYTVTDEKAVYGMRRGDVYYMLGSMHVLWDGYFVKEEYDLWVYQRYYGTYDMGTYYFEIYGPSRAAVEAIVRDVEQVVYK